MANLIEEAFANELDRAGRLALREMRWMGRWGFFLLWLDFLSPDVNTHLSGFVWTDRGRIVGNATVSRSAPGSRHWFISNVAVAKTHRGRGTARQLMDAAIEYVKEMRGQSISLQVRRGNVAAVHLYESLGFKYVSAASFFYMARITSVPHIPLPAGLTLRPHNLDTRDAGAAFDLARLAVPVNVQMDRPLHQSDFRLGTEVPFNNFWRGIAGLGKRKYWLVEEAGVRNRMAGTLSVIPGAWNGDHKITFMVHPDWWGALEAPLISVALAYLKNCPPRPIAFRHPDEHVTGVNALLSLGFKLERTHMWLKLVL